MSGTDLDVAVRIHVPAEVTEAGSLTAPGKKLQEIARELPAELIRLCATDTSDLVGGQRRIAGPVGDVPHRGLARPIRLVLGTAELR